MRNKAIPLYIVVLGLMLIPTACSAQMTPLAATPGVARKMLPSRLLTCVLGRATNIDTKKDQVLSDIVYEGRHEFSVMLPSIPVRTAPPPEAVDTPEPVDPRTRIMLDKSGLTKAFPNRFDRVVDMWPERVEMTTTINDPLVNLIIISNIDNSLGTAWLFMTQATDVATFDMKHIYQGPCKVQIS
jgi:hypothetical protein